MKKKLILLYIPNIIDYLRIILLLVAWYNIESPRLFLLLYISNVILDDLDGYTARKLNQVSHFGAWLDVVVDITGRGIVWCYIGKFGYAVPAWEWIVFSCNHARSACGQWKEHFNDAPFLVKKIMEKGFNTKLGFFVIAGIQHLPSCLYVFKSFNLEHSVMLAVFSFIFWMLLVGRLLGLITEAWCVYKHVIYLLDISAPRSVCIPLASTKSN